MPNNYMGKHTRKALKVWCDVVFVERKNNESNRVVLGHKCTMNKYDMVIDTT